MAKDELKKFSLYLVAIVAIVGLVGIFVMIGKFPGTDGDMAGQAFWFNKAYTYKAKSPSLKQTYVPRTRLATLKTNCTDTDGINLHKRGTIKGYYKGNSRKTTGYDQCTVDVKYKGAVKEYYCKNGYIAYKYMQCPAGEKCLSGVCKPVKTCTDTDRGSLYLGGTATGYYNHVWTSKTDKCYSSRTVLEYSCSGSTVVESKKVCPRGYECARGLCKRS